jgi:hypothetical protein
MFPFVPLGLLAGGSDCAAHGKKPSGDAYWGEELLHKALSSDEISTGNGA